jgi:hypothetical protein
MRLLPLRQIFVSPPWSDTMVKGLNPPEPQQAPQPALQAPAQPQQPRGLAVLASPGRSPDAQSWQEQLNAWSTANMLNQKYQLESTYMNSLLPGSGPPPLPFGNSIQNVFHPPAPQPPAPAPAPALLPAPAAPPTNGTAGKLLAGFLGAALAAGGLAGGMALNRYTGPAQGPVPVVVPAPTQPATGIKPSPIEFDIGVEYTPEGGTTTKKVVPTPSK